MRALFLLRLATLVVACGNNRPGRFHETWAAGRPGLQILARSVLAADSY